MIQSNSKNHLQHLHIILPTIIVAGMFVFVKSEFFYSNQAVFTEALAFDLLIGIPVLYCLLQWKNKLELKKILKVFTLVLFISTLLIPDSNFELLQAISKVLFPVLKLWVGIKIFQKLTQLIKAYKILSSERTGYRLYIAIIHSSFSGKLAEILVMEFSVIYFLFSRKRQHPYTENEFAYTSIKGTTEMVAGFIFIILIETLVAHILISQLSPILAFVCSYGSFYLILLFISILKSRNHFPIVLEKDGLCLQYGYINSSIVKYSDILKVEQTSKSNYDDFMKLSAFKGIEKHNIVIHFRTVQKITKVFGIQREYKSIGLFVDEPENLLTEISRRIHL